MSQDWKRGGRDTHVAGILCPWEKGKFECFPLTHSPPEFSRLESFLEPLPGAMRGWVATVGTIRLSPARPSMLPATLLLPSPFLSGSITLSVMPGLAPAGEP